MPTLIESYVKKKIKRECPNGTEREKDSIGLKTQTIFCLCSIHLSVGLDLAKSFT